MTFIDFKLGAYDQVRNIRTWTSMPGFQTEWLLHYQTSSLLLVLCQSICWLRGCLLPCFWPCWVAPWLPVPPRQRKCLPPPASSLSCLAASSRLQGYICSPSALPPILSLRLFLLPSFSCCNVRVSQACIYVEQGYLC